MIDGHMHLEYGPLTKEYVLEFIKQAEKMGLSEIQILDHTHRFKEFKPLYENLMCITQQKQWLENPKTKFSNSVNEFINLMKEIKTLDLPVKVTYGLECCYVPEYEDFLRETLNKYEFDFLVGSIHSINGKLYDMKFSDEILWSKYDADLIYKEYYSILCKLIKSDLFTQVGHPDTIKMFNIYPKYDLIPTYEKIADLLIEHNVKAECNTGCYYRYHHKDIGLSDELLNVFKQKGVQIITASDAHHPEEVGLYIKEATERLK